MADIVACPNCQRQLQVPETFFGQQVQCPDCRHLFQAEPPANSVQSAAPSSLTDPHPTRDEERAASERRNESRGRLRKYEDDDDDLADVGNPRRRTYLAPHRASLVLVLGLLSMCCIGAPVTGIIAWILGAGDLKEMDAGRMDPSGRGQTQTGKLLGMASVILFVLGVVGYCAVVGVAIFAGAMNAGGPRRRR